MVPRNRILIIDDEDDIRFAVRDYLEAFGYRVTGAADCRSGIEKFRDAPPDVAVVDYRLPDGTVFDLLPPMQQANPDVPVIVLTGHGSIDLAVRAIKEGAEHFLTKPVELPALKLVIERARETRRYRQGQAIRRVTGGRDALHPFEGSSAAIRELAKLAERVADSDANVLISGETGTGKGVLARWLHAHGPRADDPFVDLNCAGLATELLDSELFGHEKGAFTSAVKDKPGMLEMADHGTLFLDEIGDMTLPVQAKLLKVVEEQRFRRLGAVRDRTVDIRLIAATHQDLPDQVKAGDFRQDLYFRINTIQLRIPALRERPADIAPLARSILQRLATDIGRPEVTLDDGGLQALTTYAWPGNVRELRNVLERALLLSDGRTLGVRAFRFEGGAAPAGSPTDTSLTLREVEIQHIERVLRELRGQVPATATRLGVPKSSLYQKLKTYGIDASTFRNLEGTP
jgi:DNA-binding NtrC family response regulator